MQPILNDKAKARPSEGVAPGSVQVVPYDPQWPREFRRIRARLRPVLPGARIEHVGSTAVPGCDAKPIIDVSVGLAPGSALRVDAARSAGLEFRSVRPYSVVFALGDERGKRLANVHVRYRGSETELGDLLFRDYLRAHPTAVEEYGRLKRQIAAKSRTGGDYTRGKARFIQRTLRAAQRWAKATRKKSAR